MKYLLDTNTCVRYLNGRSPQIRAKLPTIPIAEIALCSIVKAELFTGAAKSNHPSATLASQQEFLQLFQSLPVDDAVAATYATIRAALEKAGTPIGPMDTLIAAVAVTYHLILVTHNTREFSRVSGLQIEDWEAVD